MGSYVFIWPYAADDVHITGTFDDWGKSIQMDKVGGHWEKEVDFPSADDKVLYKFIVDGEWIVDQNAPKEGDGSYNTNNVLLPHQITRKPAAATSKTDELPGAFPKTPGDEPASFSVNPIPASSGPDNPINLLPGAPVPAHEEITSNTIDSKVTTSKEDYEKAGSGPMPSEEATEFSINPIPASSGIDNPISVPAGSKLPAQTGTLDSAVTTSKEDYERAGASAAAPPQPAEESAFSVNPIPASSGIDNPISLAPGEKIPEFSEFTPHTTESTVTTSKEDYEKAGSSAFPAAAVVGAAGAAAGGAAIADAFILPKDKNVVPESGLPMGPGNTIQPNPFISSSGPGTTTSALAANVPLENDSLNKSGTDAKTSQLASELEVPLKSSPFISSSGPGTTAEELASKVPREDDPMIRSSGLGTTTAALAANVPIESSNVPEVVKESISEAHEAPEAAASPEAVREKADLEKELLSKTKTSEATGESASAAADQSSYYGLATSVPSTVEKSMQKAHAPPEAATETSAVAEKSAMEQELLSKVPSTDEAGEPAPTIAAATATTAPTATSAVAAATSVTDGKTANEAVPDTDTSSAARGPSVGAIAGGGAVGGAAALGAATFAARHKDADTEPPRVADSQKPDITTEASPATATTDDVPGQSKTTAARASSTIMPKTTALGVSSTPAAALTDGTVTPSLAEEPAVKLMQQNEGVADSSLTDTAPVHDATTTETAATGAAATGAVATSAVAAETVHDATTSTRVSTTSAPITSAAPTEITTKDVAAPSAPSTTVPVSKASATTSSATKATAEDANKAPSAALEPTGPPTLTSAGTVPAEGEVKKDTTSSTAPPAAKTDSAEPKTPTTPVKKTTQSAAAPQSPVASTATSNATEKKKKKRHRIREFFHKVFD